MTWWRVHRDGSTADVRLFGLIGAYADTTEELLREIEGVTDIRLTINSEGGNANAGMDLFLALRGRCSVATVTGVCASAAVLPFLSAARREILPGGRIMVHHSTHAAFGDSATLRQAADFLDRHNAHQADVLAAATEQPRSVIDRWLARDTWFLPEQAVAAGLVDIILPSPTSPAAEPVTAPDDAGDDGSEALVLDVLRACGRIRVRDRRRFERNLGMLLAGQVEEIPAPVR